MLLIDGNGTPCGNMIESASPHEVNLIESLLAQRAIHRRPKKLIYDKAADSDPLRSRLLKRGIDLIAPHKSNRVKPPTQDGRKLRRYRKRWKVERSISWLHNFRRLVTRYEFYHYIFQGFVNLACLINVAKRF
jgi:transposase